MRCAHARTRTCVARTHARNTHTHTHLRAHNIDDFNEAEQRRRGVPTRPVAVRCVAAGWRDGMGCRGVAWHGVGCGGMGCGAARWGGMRWGAVGCGTVPCSVVPCGAVPYGGDGAAWCGAMRCGGMWGGVGRGVVWYDAVRWQCGGGAMSACTCLGSLGRRPHHLPQRLNGRTLRPRAPPLPSPTMHL